MSVYERAYTDAMRRHEGLMWQNDPRQKPPMLARVATVVCMALAAGLMWMAADNFARAVVFQWLGAP